MMLGESSYGGRTVHVPPWSSAAEDPASYALSPTAVNANGSIDDYSLFFQTDSLKALQRYLPSNSNDVASELQFADSENGEFLPVDAHSCDNFRMFEFKVRNCTRGRSHDWTECPFAHPGEKARRRDPRKYHYSGTACPDFRKGSCRKGDMCEFAHGVFECWLHPARYRTQPCKDDMNCKRRVCFFAHSPDQLRVLSPRAESYDGSPHGRLAFMSSPESGSPPSESPPMSPMTANSVGEMAALLRQLHLSKVKSMPSSRLRGCPSPRMSVAPPSYFSMPTTPTQPAVRPGLGYFEAWDSEEQMERVESGRDLRAKMFEKLSKENPLDRVQPDPDPNPNPNPDVGWVSDLIN